MVERYEVLAQYPITWTAFTSALLVGIMPWLITLLVASVGAGLLMNYFKRHADKPTPSS